MAAAAAPALTSLLWLLLLMLVRRLFVFQEVDAAATTAAAVGAGTWTGTVVEEKEKGSAFASNLNGPAFCQSLDRLQPRPYFPLDVPEAHLPWVWDAIFDQQISIVEVITISRMACRFDQLAWQQLTKWYPRYKAHFGNGLESNILVPVDPELTADADHELLGDTTVCHFFVGAQRVYSAASWLIQGMRTRVRYGALQIRCPVPRGLVWETMSIQVNSTQKPYFSDPNYYSMSTPRFPVCHTPDRPDYAHDISICTATSRASKPLLTEWIEYYREMGIDHFFIYDTSRAELEGAGGVADNEGTLAKVLGEYIDSGVVSVIPWHYMNCVRHMASGRSAVYYDQIQNRQANFVCPRAIAQTAALASCYSRFRRTSRFMIHVDDDEFIHLPPKKDESVVANTASVASNPSNGLLKQYIDSRFQRARTAPAIYVNPVVLTPCFVAGRINYSDPNSLAQARAAVFNSSRPMLAAQSTQRVSWPNALPRLGKWDLATVGFPFEGKLVMRTEAVVQFFVHYLMLLEPGWAVADMLRPKLREVQLLHYKEPWQLSMSLTEATLPFTSNSLLNRCYWIGNGSSSRHRLFRDLRFSNSVIVSVDRRFNQNFNGTARI